MSEPFALGSSLHDTVLCPLAWVTATFAGAHGTPGAASESSLLGVCVTPLRTYVTSPHDAFFFSHVHAFSSLELEATSPCNHVATAPVTCGAAIDVPSSSTYVGETPWCLGHDDTICRPLILPLFVSTCPPGAKMSTQAP